MTYPDPGLDPQLDPWLTGMVLPWRNERQTTLMASGQRQPWFWYDNTCPVLVDGSVRDNGCPFPAYGLGRSGLGYEWSPAHQSAFEDAMRPLIDLARWDALVSDVQSHWINATSNWGADEIAWLSAIAPGARPVLHELGKTPEFRRLRAYFLDPNDRTPEAIVLDDPRLEDYPPEPSRNRAARISERGMVEWYSSRYTDVPWTPQVCAICGEEFWPNLLDSSAFTRFGMPRYCAPCVRLAASDVWGLGHIPNDLLAPLLVTVAQKFYELTDVFPHQSVKLTPVGELSDLERDRWMRLIMLMPRPDTAKAVFGSWREYLHAAGLLEKAPRKGHGGYVTVANDGHVTLSIGERLVCDWLYAHGIDHEKEPVYPQHPDLNPGGLLRADWLIGDCWVELAGRMSDAKYAEKMALKQDLAQQLGLRHLVLLPLEVKRLEPIAAAHWGWQLRA
jgi:hypothetical protein